MIAIMFLFVVCLNMVDFFVGCTLMVIWFVGNCGRDRIRVLWCWCVSWGCLVRLVPVSGGML